MKKTLKNFLSNEDGITAIEYAIIGVAMSSALFYIFDEGGFLESLEDAWGTMEKNIKNSGKVLGSS
ncbi:Flp family type IVb pilin [Vibrio campbellii]|uniref:Flp family type IVb pilin n=1 Tax=Vibrio campbellii TaxID=680 RepID=UPI003CE46BC7